MHRRVSRHVVRRVQHASHTKSEAHPTSLPLRKSTRPQYFRPASRIPVHVFRSSTPGGFMQRNFTG